MTTVRRLSPGDYGVQVTQIRSVIGGKQNHRDTLRSLGLRKIGQSVQRKADAVTVGMINTVPHLVSVEISEEGR